MKKLLFMVVLLMTSLLQQAIAQDRAISGRVTDRANSQGLPGVTVLVKGTTIGASTNSDGTYTLNVPASATTLSFTSIGYISVDRPIGTASTIDIGLGVDSKQLGEVVVTALGIERTRNSLAYSATQVEGTEITKARNPNFINGLSGKVAGLTVRQSNTLGGSSNVVIRGTKSITGNNQALFVVDGVPISNANTNTAGQQSGAGGYDYGNAGADVNPDDIATMTVLKGAAATALYGERAANGVILITTKKGRKGLGVTVNTGITAGRINKDTFIEHQKEYGAGYGRVGDSSINPYFNGADLNGDGVIDLYPQLDADASMGARFDRNLQVFQWNAFSPGNANFGKATPWVAAENDPTTFFETAITTNNSFSIDGGSDNGYFKLGYNNVVDKGVLPNSRVDKNIVNFAASFNLTPKLTTSAAVNFTRVNGKGRYGTGYDGANGSNPMTMFRQWWQTNVDIKEQKAAYDFQGLNAGWNLNGPGTSSSFYWNNPYWTRNRNFQTDERFRTFGNVATTYKVTDWFNVLGRVTLDTYDEQQEERIAVGSNTTSLPSYTRFNRTAREANYDLIGNFSKNVTESISLRGLVGVNVRREAFKSIRATTNGGLVVPDLYTIGNSLNPPTPPIEGESKRGVDGIFASATVGFREMIFVDATVRRDKSTTLPQKKNAFIYPSVAGNFVFSEMMKDVTWMSYGKLRANYAEVGQGAPIQSILDVYDKPTAFGSIPLFSVPGTKNNQDLVPERTKAIEVGVEMAFLQGRFGFDATVYQQRTLDQIFPVELSTATGYNSRFVNSGEVRNRGVELTAFLSPIRTDAFNWTVNANWTKNQNKVVSLFQGTDNIVLGSYQGGVSSNATVGQPYGSLRGTDFVYLNGQKVVGEDGQYLRSATANVVIGNPNPDWVGGITNSFSYKGLAFSFLFDIRQGGDVFSLDRAYGMDTGQTIETVGKNDKGNETRSDVADGGGVKFPGVKADGTPNNVYADNTGDSGHTAYGISSNPAAAFVYDASFVKLRELTLSYSLPQSIMSKVGAVKGAEISLVGRNLFIFNNSLPGADPEEALSSGNLGQGYSSGAYPSVRTLGANLRLSF
ncbi:SusC/RagA family TonB-linked outer membrane protein [Hymenobacter fastidiosus]